MYFCDFYTENVVIQNHVIETIGNQWSFFLPVGKRELLPELNIPTTGFLVLLLAFELNWVIRSGLSNL